MNLYESGSDVVFQYGTAGFRHKADILPHVVYRCGLLAVLRSANVGCQAVGLCITASHNPACDNGVKLIDSNGHMLHPDFEPLATSLVNSKNLRQTLDKMIKSLSLDVENICRAVVIVGRDTRASSPHLADLAIRAVHYLKANCIDLAEATTPQVHYAVYSWNTGTIQSRFMCRASQSLENIDSRAIGKELLAEYYSTFIQRLIRPLLLCFPSYPMGGDDPSDRFKAVGAQFCAEQLVVDGANGVGAHPMTCFMNVLKKALNVTATVRNDGLWPGDVVNGDCGAEFVHKKELVPRRFGSEARDPGFLRCCAFDGDADRLVYFTTDTFTGRCIVLDGDKIGFLFTKAILMILSRLGTHTALNISVTDPPPPVRVGAIQTGYANGASTAALKSLKEELLEGVHCNIIDFHVARANTGVKHLQRATEAFDIAVYFESNGHGSVVYNRQRIENWAEQHQCKATREFAQLESFLDMFNPAIGDAIVNVLAVEFCLKYLRTSFLEWMHIYTNRPYLQRSIPMTREQLNQLQVHAEDETLLKSPPELVKIFGQYNTEFQRVFLRPSGTEPVARLYVEAVTEGAVQELAETLSAVITGVLVSSEKVSTPVFSKP